jgi:drug/metabolite transporter (DMT)-like permease
MLHVEAARGGVIGNLEPLIGAALGVVFLGDVLGPFSLAGGVLLLIAAVLVTRPVHPRVIAPAEVVP